MYLKQSLLRFHTSYIKLMFFDITCDFIQVISKGVIYTRPLYLPLSVPAVSITDKTIYLAHWLVDSILPMNSHNQNKITTTKKNPTKTTTTDPNNFLFFKCLLFARRQEI